MLSPRVTPGQPLTSLQKSGLEWVARLHGSKDVVLAVDLTGSVGLNDSGRTRLTQIIKDSLELGDSVYIVPFASKVYLPKNAIQFRNKTQISEILNAIPFQPDPSLANTDIQRAEITIYQYLAQQNQDRLNKQQPIKPQSVIWITDAPLFMNVKDGCRYNSSQDWVETPLRSPFRNLGSPESQLRQAWLKALCPVMDKRSLPLGSYNLTVVDIAAIKHNFDFAVVLEALEILKVLQEHVQRQTGQLTGLIYWLESLKSAYEREQSALKQLNLDEMSGEAIFANEDIDSCYNVLLPQNELRAQLVQITEELIEPLGTGSSLVLMVDQARTTREQLQQEINLTVDRLFGSRTASIVQSVIKRFHQSYPTTGRAARLGQILQQAEPLLPLKKDKYFYDNPAKSSKLIGFKNTDEAEVQQFKSTLSRDLNIPDNVFRPTQAEDEILIVTEYAAFPLRLINGLEQLRNHYIHAKNVPNSFLHNDRRHLFTDIIPPDVRIMEV